MFFCVLDLELYVLCMHFLCKPFNGYVILKYLFLFSRLSLLCWRLFLLCKTFFSLMQSHLFIFCFCCPYPERHNQVNIVTIDAKEFTACGFFSEFYGSGLTLKSLTHSKFIFVHNLRSKRYTLNMETQQGGK